MITFLRGNICSLLLLSALGVATASADSSAPNFNVTLTSWQLNFTTGQETFSLEGPGISLSGTGYDDEVPTPPLVLSPRYENHGYAGYFRVSNTHGGTFAQGTVDGQVFTAANPLGLFGNGSGFPIPPIPTPGGTDPSVSFPISLTGSFDANGNRIYSSLAGCTPDCLTTSGANYYFDFVPASGTVQLQFAGPDAIGDYTLESLNITASPTPEPASYTSLALGLFILCLFAAQSSRSSGNICSRKS